MKRILSFLISAILLYFIITYVLKVIGGTFGVVTSIFILAGAIFLLQKVTQNLD